MRVVDLEEAALVGEALVLQRLEEDLEGLVVELADVLDAHAGLRRAPAVPAPDAELVAPAGEDRRGGDPRCQHRRVVERQAVQHRAEADPLRARGDLGEQRERVGRDREAREEEVLDDRVGVVAEAVGVDDLLLDLGVEALRRLPRPQLHLGVDAEPHPFPPRGGRRRRPARAPTAGPGVGLTLTAVVSNVKCQIGPTLGAALSCRRGPSMETYDAIVIGSGHNGLVAAVYLARAGWRVLVLERAEYPGGAVRSEELTRPGLVHDVFATNMNLFRGSPVAAELGAELERAGLAYATSDRPFANVYPDGRALRVLADREATLAGLRAHDAADADGLGGARRQLRASRARAVRDLRLAPGHPARSPGAPWSWHPRCAAGAWASWRASR